MPGYDDSAEGDWDETNGSIVDTTQTTGDIRFTSVTVTPTDAEQVTIENNSSWDVDISD